MAASAQPGEYLAYTRCARNAPTDKREKIGSEQENYLSPHRMNEEEPCKKKAKGRSRKATNESSYRKNTDPE